ncbi:MAG: 50S ribosomal protein L4 [Planctomycetia bacterium]|nr:50S ribosomal protein L4 [Planctomycetia bacterium]
MASLPIYNRSGSQVGSYEIDPTDLAPRINKQLLHEVVVMYQANKRFGTAKTKSRAEVAGSTKKMYRQKGTGNARAGGRRSPVRRGGGHTFAKRPRDWYFRLPRKAVQLATRMAFASKIISEQVVVIDELKFAAPKTKEMYSILKALKCDGASLLVTTAAYDKLVYMSARNIDKVSVLHVADLNALSILQPRKLLVTREALDAIKQRAAAKSA